MSHVSHMTCGHSLDKFRHENNLFLFKGNLTSVNISFHTGISWDLLGEGPLLSHPDLFEVCPFSFLALYTKSSYIVCSVTFAPKIS